ncbi:MAG TPA: family 43 glycosylhydrolase [Sphingobium sp.]
MASLAAGVGNLALSSPSAIAQSSGRSSKRYRSFRPGELWLDTAGKPIQAHGGSIIEVDGTFYWYGENKEFTDGSNGIWTWGVRAYTSRDLYNWDDLGLIIKPDIDDQFSPLSPYKALLDRPHIIYDSNARRYICWIKVMNRPVTHQTRTVLVADTIKGPWRIVKTAIRPLDLDAGDFDVVVDPRSRKGYMYFQHPNTDIVCADLTPDLTDFAGPFSKHFPTAGPPATREAPAFFTRGENHYLVTSGMSGYFPNPSEVAVAKTYHGPWQVLGDLHPQDESRTSFDSQIASVFKHPHKRDLYIALADRWTAGLSPAMFESARRGFAKLSLPKRQPLTPDEIKGVLAADMYKLGTSAARYIWLPITFEGERPVIRWRSEWSLDEFS